MCESEGVNWVCVRLFSDESFLSFSLFRGRSEWGRSATAVSYLLAPRPHLRVKYSPYLCTLIYSIHRTDSMSVVSGQWAALALLARVLSATRPPWWSVGQDIESKMCWPLYRTELGALTSGAWPCPPWTCPSCCCCMVADAVGPMHDLATDSNTLSSSGAQCVKLRLQKAYRGFLMSSIKVINSPHWGVIRKIIRCSIRFVDGFSEVSYSGWKSLVRTRRMKGNKLYERMMVRCYDNDSLWRSYRVRSVYDESLQQNPRDLFLDSLGVCFSEQSQYNTREVVCVTVLGEEK